MFSNSYGRTLKSTTLDAPNLAQKKAIETLTKQGKPGAEVWGRPVGLQAALQTEAPRVQPLTGGFPMPPATTCRRLLCDRRRELV